MKAFGRIDALVSNAGICPFYSFLDIPHKVWELTRSVNVSSNSSQGWMDLTSKHV